MIHIPLKVPSYRLSCMVQGRRNNPAAQICIKCGDGSHGVAGKGFDFLPQRSGSSSNLAAVWQAYPNRVNAVCSHRRAAVPGVASVVSSRLVLAGERLIKSASNAKRFALASTDWSAGIPMLRISPELFIVAWQVAEQGPNQ